MGSVMPPAEQTDSSSGSLLPKLEPPDAYDSTPDQSSPEPEGLADAPAQQSDAPVVVKRKGGRKPIYATSEERKQRNRQAQAAFRERRTEYIKQLEETIKQQETTLQNLQQSHRSAADECLMLRYKNSLLERLLLEKGIDVQAELRMKGTPNSMSTRFSATSPTGQASPMQRAMMNRQQQGRVPPGMPRPGPPGHSPSMHTSPSSQHSSTSTGKSPGYSVQGGISPPTSDIHAQSQMQTRGQPPFVHHPTLPRPPPSSQSYQSTSSTVQTGFYPSSFQKHYDQLEQEYAHDAQQAEIMDGVNSDADRTSSTAPTPNEIDQYSTSHPHPSTTGNNYSNLPPHLQNHQQRPPPSAGPMGIQGQPPHNSQQHQQSGSNESNPNIFAHGPGHPLFDPFDPMLDADPFGLTASMHFQTPFNYEQQNHGSSQGSGHGQGSQQR